MVKAELAGAVEEVVQHFAVVRWTVVELGPCKWQKSRHFP